jgi:oxalate decarboxylase/phosphoglucose isomerase-like protein (cupin superfamily)
MRAAILLATCSALLSSAVPLTRREQNGQTGWQGKNGTTGRLNPTYTTEQKNNIKLALSAVDRLTYIQSLGDTDDYFKFDYSVGANPNPVAGVGQGGQGDLSYVDNWPVLLDLGVAMSMGFIKPCGMNTPHTHNRATELLVVVQGGNVHTSFVQESGLTTPITTTLNQYQGAVLPIGSIHYEFNDSCEPAVFVAAFSNEDPGLSRTAQNFFGEDGSIVKADLGFPHFLDAVNIPAFQKTIPKAFALGAQECLKRCGIKYNATEH